MTLTSEERAALERLRQHDAATYVTESPYAYLDNAERKVDWDAKYRDEMTAIRLALRIVPEYERYAKALQKIADAREYINGMVIDPCPTVLCTKRETKDVAITALQIPLTRSET